MAFLPSCMPKLHVVVLTSSLVSEDNYKNLKCLYLPFSQNCCVLKVTNKALFGCNTSELHFLLLLKISIVSVTD